MKAARNHRNACTHFMIISSWRYIFMVYIISMSTNFTRMPIEKNKMEKKNICMHISDALSFYARNDYILWFVIALCLWNGSCFSRNVCLVLSVIFFSVYLNRYIIDKRLKCQLSAVRPSKFTKKIHVLRNVHYEMKTDDYYRTDWSVLFRSIFHVFSNIFKYIYLISGLTHSNF